MLVNLTIDHSTVDLNVTITVFEPPQDQGELVTLMVEQGRNVLVRCSVEGLEENDTIEWLRIVDGEEESGNSSTVDKKVVV